MTGQTRNLRHLLPAWNAQRGLTKARCKSSSLKLHISCSFILYLITPDITDDYKVGGKWEKSASSGMKLTRYHKHPILPISLSITSKTQAMFTELTLWWIPKVHVHKPTFARLGGEGSVWVCSGQGTDRTSRPRNSVIQTRTRNHMSIQSSIQTHALSP